MTAARLVLERIVAPLKPTPPRYILSCPQPLLERPPGELSAEDQAPHQAQPGAEFGGEEIDDRLDLIPDPLPSSF
jgi:hypothetical protein